MIEINWNPQERQLRQFGLISAFALPLAGWLFAGRPAMADWSTEYVGLLGLLLAIGATMAAIGHWRPAWLRGVFLAASLAAFPIGMVVSQIVLLVIFFGIFLPVALWFRLIGRDALCRRIDRRATSYWEPVPQTAEIRRYYRQS